MNGAPQLALDFAALPQPLPGWSTWSPTDAWQFAMAGLTLVLALLALPTVIAHVVAALRTLPTRTRAGVVAALMVGLVMRLVVSTQLVMLFGAYEITEQSAVPETVGRYGAGAQVLHQALFHVLPPDHGSLVWLHRIAGSLALWPLLALFIRLGLPPAGTLLAAWGLATLPLLLRDAASESILVVGALWLWSGLLLWQTRRPMRALVLLGAAVMTRPELLYAALLLVAALSWDDRPVWTKRQWTLLALLAVMLVAPQVWHTVERMQIDAARGHHRLEKLFPLGPLAALGSFVPLWPHAFPLAWTVLALRGLPGERLRQRLVLATYVWTIALLVDLPWTSVPRLEAPIAALWLLLGAWTWAEIQTRKPLALLWIVVTTAPTLWLFHATNEADTERLLQTALPALPAQGACLVTLHESDPPDKGKVQRAFPTYLLRPPHRNVARYAMQQWENAGSPVCAGGTFLWIDHRCYAVYDHAETEPAQLAICEQIRHAHDWTPVVVERVPNRGQNEYHWYPPVDAFELGLWRLSPKSPPRPDPVPADGGR